MNGVPPVPPEPPDDVDEEYRRASARDSGRPSEAVRRAVLEHAERLAAERAARERASTARRWWSLARELRRPAMVGSLAAAVLAALVIAPQFLAPRTSPVAEQTRSAAPAAGGPAAPATAPAISQPGVAPGAPAVTDRGAPEPARERGGVTSNVRRVAPMAGAVGDAAPAARAALAEPVAAADPAAAFRHAAETGDLATLQALRAGQASLDAGDPLGRTALMLATLHGQRGAVALLLAWGADPNVADTGGTTPLGAAIARRDTELAAMLKHYGAR